MELRELLNIVKGQAREALQKTRENLAKLQSHVVDKHDEVFFYFFYF